MGANPDSLWVTFDTPQSRQLLEGRRVHYLPYIGPRDSQGHRRGGAGDPSPRCAPSASTPRSAPARRSRPRAFRSPRCRSVPATYVESVCRLHGPSATGRILEHVPGVQLRTPHPHGGGRRLVARRRQHPRPTSAASPCPSARAARSVCSSRSARSAAIASTRSSTRCSRPATRTTTPCGSSATRLRPDVLPGHVLRLHGPGGVRTRRPGGRCRRHACRRRHAARAARDGHLPRSGGAARAARTEHVDDHQTEIADLVNSTSTSASPSRVPDLTAADARARGPATHRRRAAIARPPAPREHRPQQEANSVTQRATSSPSGAASTRTSATCVLRRPLLDWAREAGPLHVYVGDSPRRLRRGPGSPARRRRVPLLPRRGIARPARSALAGTAALDLQAGRDPADADRHEGAHRDAPRRRRSCASAAARSSRIGVGRAQLRPAPARAHVAVQRPQQLHPLARRPHRRLPRLRPCDARPRLSEGMLDDDSLAGRSTTGAPERDLLVVSLREDDEVAPRPYPGRRVVRRHPRGGRPRSGSGSASSRRFRSTIDALAPARRGPRRSGGRGVAGIRRPRPAGGAAARRLPTHRRRRQRPAARDHRGADRGRGARRPAAR